MGTELKIKFWGTRGLISTPGSQNSIFGGNTSCIQILWKDNLILVDTGFGASVLGERLIKNILTDKVKYNTHLFYTHFHWDHVQGLPFFHPIYFKGQTLNIYSPCEPEATETNLDILFDGSYSPFAGLKNMPANINICQLKVSQIIDGLTIDFIEVQHIAPDKNQPADKTFAYRFRCPDGKTICIVTDHEAQKSPINDGVISFIKDCDLLVHDGQYFSEEYVSKKGWGHSSVEMALENQINSGAKKCLITHHDPDHNDEDIQNYQRKLLKVKEYADINYEFAREGFIYTTDPLQKPEEDKS